MWLVIKSGDEFHRKQQNSVKQLSFNKKIRKKRRNNPNPTQWNITAVEIKSRKVEMRVLYLRRFEPVCYMNEKQVSESSTCS